jgi:hypothetical protein
VSGQVHPPATLFWEKSPPHPLGRRLGGLQSRSGRCGIDRNVLPLPGFDTLCYYSVAFHRVWYHKTRVVFFCWKDLSYFMTNRSLVDYSLQLLAGQFVSSHSVLD